MDVINWLLEYFGNEIRTSHELKTKSKTIMKLNPGMLIKTNYSGPYRIAEIKRGCTCPLYLDELNSDDPPPQPEHIHLVLTKPGASGKFYIGHFFEESLRSLQKTYCGFKTEPDFDRIIILENDRPVQMALF